MITRADPSGYEDMSAFFAEYKLVMEDFRTETQARINDVWSTSPEVNPQNRNALIRLGSLIAALAGEFRSSVREFAHGSDFGDDGPPPNRRPFLLVDVNRDAREERFRLPYSLKLTGHHFPLFNWAVLTASLDDETGNVNLTSDDQLIACQIQNAAELKPILEQWLKNIGPAYVPPDQPIPGAERKRALV